MFVFYITLPFKKAVATGFVLSTETLGGPRPIVLRPSHEPYPLVYGFYNGNSSVPLYKGLAVKLKSDGTIDIASAAGDYVIGWVDKTPFPANQPTLGTNPPAASPGALVSIVTIFYSDLNAITNVNVTPGAPMRPDGTVDSSGRPNYVPCNDHDIVTAIALTPTTGGSVAGQPIVLGQLRVPYKYSVTVGKTIVAGQIIAAHTSTTTDFGSLLAGDVVVETPVPNGTPANTTGGYFGTVVTNGTLPFAAVVGSLYTVYRVATS